jgi:hypothetical protein
MGLKLDWGYVFLTLSHKIFFFFFFFLFFSVFNGIKYNLGCAILHYTLVHFTSSGSIS